MKPRLPLALALTLVAWSALPITRAETPEEAFERAGAAYSEGRFEDAAQLYRGLAELGFEDARLDYNLGNAEFKCGRLGRAVLYYQRARHLAPTDPDVRANLDYARSFAADKVERPELPAPLAAWVDLQERVGVDRQGWIVLAGVWLLAAILAAGLARPGRWNATWGWVLTGVFLALALAGASWRATWTRLEGTPLAVVLDTAVEVLAGPGANNATLFTIHEGMTVQVRDDPGGEWLQISLPNGLNGWIPRDAAGKV